MKKRMMWFILAALLLLLTGCTRTSEATVNVYNKGELTVKVTIYYSTSELAPGKTETFTLTWPGKGAMSVSMVYYPVGQPLRSQYQDLELNDGDDITVNVEFKKN